MKKIFKPFFILTTLCFALVLSSCLSENDIVQPYNGEPGGVVIRFEGGASVRSTVQGETAVVFDNGHLFMVTDVGTIVHHFVINGGSGTSNPAAGVLFMNELQSASGVRLPSVSVEVRRIVVVGNTNLNLTSSAVGMNIDDIGAREINVLDQHNVNRVNLWGESLRSSWGLPNTGNLYRYQAHVQVFPTVARLELHRIEACINSEIASFRVEAIFIDRHYYDAHVSGFIPGAGDAPTLSPRTNFVSRGDGTTAGFRFPTTTPTSEFGYTDYATNRALFDFVGVDANRISSTTPLFVAQTGTNRWAYNLFAMQNTATSTGTRMPHIIIRLSDVTLECGWEYDDYQYLTIRGIILDGETNALPGIHARNVYRFHPVIFNELNLSDRPNVNFIDVNARITLAHWNGHSVYQSGFWQPGLPSLINIGCDQTVEERTLRLGVATCGNCPVPYIRYRWLRSTDGAIWSTDDYLFPVGNRLNDFVMPVLTGPTYFRRVAICHCGRHYTQPVLVSLPETHIFPPYVFINGIYWSTGNSCFKTSTGFVSHPGDAGMLFQWGRDRGWRPNPGVTWSDPHEWWVPGTGWENTTWNGIDYMGTTWNNQPCPVGWRVPTKDDFIALIEATIDEAGSPAYPRVLTRDEAIALGFGCEQMGGTAFGNLGNRNEIIFLPATGWLDDSGGGFGNVRIGHYWTADNNAPGVGYSLDFDARPGDVREPQVDNQFPTQFGFGVRCVRDRRRYLYVNPPTIALPPTGTATIAVANRTVTVTTSAASWTADSNYGWISINNTTGTSGGTFVVTVTTQSPTQRTGTITVTAPNGLTATVTVVQYGYYSPPINAFYPTEAFVGAFWRHNQRGERLINISLGATDIPNDAEWTVVATEPWIVMDTAPRATNSIEINPIGADTPYHLTDASGIIDGYGDIYFRIGLTNTIAQGTHRYGRVLISLNNGEWVHTIWIRQGESPDFLMRPRDPLVVPGLGINRTGEYARPVARRISAFNTTVPASAPATWNDLYVIPNRGGDFTRFPSQAGALFRWNDREALPAVGTVTWSSRAHNSDACTAWDPNPGTGARENRGEVCPTGYRHKNDANVASPLGGSVTISEENMLASELRQSLFLRPPHTDRGGSAANITIGFYADGFFDRRPPQQPTSAGASPALFPAVVGENDARNAAFRGTLFFNPYSGASVFLPAPGHRNTGVGGANVASAGGWSSYWTSTAVRNDEAPPASNRSAMVLRSGMLQDAGAPAVNPWAPAAGRGIAFPVRCVRYAP